MSSLPHDEDFTFLFGEFESDVGNTTNEPHDAAAQESSILTEECKSNNKFAESLGDNTACDTKRNKQDTATYIFDFGQKPTITSVGGEGTDSSATPPPTSSCTPPQGGEVVCGGGITDAVVDRVDVDQLQSFPDDVGATVDNHAPQCLLEGWTAHTGSTEGLFGYGGANDTGASSGLDLLPYAQPGWNSDLMFGPGVGDTLNEAPAAFLTGDTEEGGTDTTRGNGDTSGTTNDPQKAVAQRRKCKRLRQSKVVAKWWWHLGTEHWNTRVEGGVYVKGVLTAVKGSSGEEATSKRSGEGWKRVKEVVGEEGEMEERKKPSRFCHICLRRAEKVTAVACGNLKAMRCRKVVCRRCFEEYGWDWRSATGTESQWICTHCRKDCPERAQCFNYSRTNNRRHVALMRKKTEMKQKKMLSENAEGVSYDGNSDGNSESFVGALKAEDLVEELDVNDDFRLL